MQIIADSGSTKTKFALLGKSGQEYVFTEGINPYYQSTEEILLKLQTQLLPQLPVAPESVSSIEFYGAGCTPAKASVVAEALKTLFGKAEIVVGSDLLGAAKALCGKKAGIACILGTGSNSCLYDGKQIVSNVSPLGYILGDEGSGAVLGKMLVGDILKNQAPATLCEKFYNTYTLAANDIIDKVYRQSFPNRFLASFAPFIHQNLDHEYCKNLVYNAFVLFIQRNLKQYPNFKQYHIHFTGSVAWYFQDLLKKALHDEGLQCGSICKEPF